METARGTVYFDITGENIELADPAGRMIIRNEDDGTETPINVTHRRTIALGEVHEKGTIFAPPTSHLGQQIAEPYPQVVANLAAEHARKTLAEAYSRFAVKS